MEDIRSQMLAADVDPALRRRQQQEQRDLACATGFWALGSARGVPVRVCLQN